MGWMGLDRARFGIVIALSLCLLATSAPVVNAASDKVLVLLDNLSMQQTHSKFLQNLNSKAFDVTYATLDTKTIQLKDWDDWLFERLVILGGKTSEMQLQCLFYFIKFLAFYMERCLLSSIPDTQR